MPDAGCEVDEIILHAETYLTTAIQVTQPNGRERTVYLFEEHNVNQRPSDRDQLIEPDLSGLKVTSLTGP